MPKASKFTCGETKGLDLSHSKGLNHFCVTKKMSLCSGYLKKKKGSKFKVKEKQFEDER